MAVSEKAINFIQGSLEKGRPIPGQSLTNAPDQPYNWEKPSEYTNPKEAMLYVFETLTVPETTTNLLLSLSNGVGVIDIASITLYSGFLEGNNKISAIMDATVLVQSSLQEQGPRVPFEAVLLGTPVIVTENTGSGELVELFDAGEMVEYNNTEQLSQKLQYVIENLEIAKSRTNNAAIKIRDEMNLEKVIRQYKDLYVSAKRLT